MLVISGIPFVRAQQQEKFMTYNLLNYDAADTSRNPYFRTVINSVRPDVLVVQEIIGLNSVNVFRRQVMNAVSINYASGLFIDGPDTDNAVFFDSLKFRFVLNTPIRTAYRNLNEFRMIHRATGDTLRLFACHLKADTGSLNMQRRAAQVDSLRKITDALPQGASFITLGDFNIYGSTEPAYQKLIQVTPSYGHFVDPITITGTWNNNSYRVHHTQSTRTRSFGNGSTGGLDDRFDIIMNSSSVAGSGKVRYVPASLTPYGNDGQHYNDSINKPPNNAVSQSVANALHYASDHLPVHALYNFFPSQTSLEITLAIQGFYDELNLTHSITDTVTAYLRYASSPYSISDSAKAPVDSVLLKARFLFSNTFSGSYYIVIKGRNVLETWSRAAGENIVAGTSNHFSFSDSPAKAYGSNLIFKGGRYCLYNGDINNDGIIDLTDISLADNDAFNFVTGFVKTDVNGDRTVDVLDLLLTDNNALNIVSTVRP